VSRADATLEASSLRGRARGGTGPRRRRPLRRSIYRIFMGVAVALLIIVEVYPLIWLLLQSFKTDPEFSLHPVWALPEGLYWQNWSTAWTTGNLSTYFKNSVLATFPSLLFIIVLGVSASFGLEIMKWRLRNGVLLIFLGGILVPLQMVLLPMFTIYFHLHLINSLWALIITYTGFGLPLTVFLMTSYLRALPKGILEAATLDGASIYTAFVRVAVPMMSNAIMTVALVQFFFIWNDLLFSLTFISDDNTRTIQTGLLNFTGQYGQVSWGPTFAAVTMTALPTLALYLILNKRVIRGLTAGGLKG
jgi:raffinose/stachyose/melibiose transport system permease protein